MNGMDVDYCLRRAEEERLHAASAVTPEAARAHQELRELYLFRSRDRQSLRDVAARAV